MDDAQRPHRRPSLRLKGYDYAQSGGYFVTICTQHRRSLFGEIVENAMQLNDAGQMVERVWQSLPERFAHLLLDVFVVMPNHVHGVLMIQDEKLGQRLGQIVGAFKGLTTNAYMKGVRGQGWPAFDARLWQDNYYEHIVRNDDEMDRIRAYVVGNPQLWEQDPERLVP